MAVFAGFETLKRLADAHEWYRDIHRRTYACVICGVSAGDMEGIMFVPPCQGFPASERPKARDPKGIAEELRRMVPMHRMSDELEAKLLDLAERVEKLRDAPPEPKKGKRLIDLG